MTKIESHWLLEKISELHHTKAEELAIILSKKGKNYSENARKEVANILRLNPELFVNDIMGKKGFTEINQLYIGSEKKTGINKKVNFNQMRQEILSLIPNLESLYPKIFNMINHDNTVVFEIYSLINSYKDKELGLLYIPGFNRSLQGPIGSDILAHVIPLLDKNKENINFNYPGNGFLGDQPGEENKGRILSRDVLSIKNSQQFNLNFDFEIFEFLIFLILKSGKSVKTLYSHSLGPVFAVKIMSKLGKDANKIKQTVFLNPALDQEKLARFWCINAYVEEEKNIIKLKQTGLLNQEMFDKFLQYRKKSNFVRAFFINTFFKDGKFLLEKHEAWKQFLQNNNKSYSESCFNHNFLFDFNNLTDEIKNKIIVISTEGYSTVPMDSLRGEGEEPGIESIINIDLEDHYGHSKKDIEKIHRTMSTILKNSRQ